MPNSPESLKESLQTEKTAEHWNASIKNIVCCSFVRQTILLSFYCSVCIIVCPTDSLSFCADYFTFSVLLYCLLSGHSV